VRALLAAAAVLLSGREGPGAADEDAARAPPAAVDLALVLAVDVSESVDAEKYELQHEGIARAFENPQLVSALAAGENGAIMILVMEWSDRDKQVVTADWTRVGNADQAAAFARRVRATRRTSDGLTAIGDALLAAAAQFERLSGPAARKVVDLSGDGIANIGPSPKDVRNVLVGRGITINGLPILTEEPWLDQYYKDYVIGGPGAFLMQTEDFQSFAAAMLNKLLAEVVALPPDLAVRQQARR
jgi:hypothetical protein